MDTSTEKSAAPPLPTMEVGGFCLPGFYLRDGFCCAYCGLDFLADPRNYAQMTMDHVVPKKFRRQGHVVASCQTCNSIKSSYVPTGKRLVDQIEDARRYIKEQLAALGGQLAGMREAMQAALGEIVDQQARLPVDEAGEMSAVGKTFLQLLCDGASVVEIATTMGMSRNGAFRQRKFLFSLSGTTSDVQLVTWAQGRGLVKVNGREATLKVA